MGTTLREPATVAVDQATGDVFVADPGAGMVDAYSSSGVFLTQFGEGKLLAVGVAVDEASGLVYVADSFQDAVLVFKPNGLGEYRLLSEWSGEAVPGGEFGEVAGVAVDNSKDASAGDVYVVDGESSELAEGVVDAFKPRPAGAEEAQEGEYVRDLTEGKMEFPNAIAVSHSSGETYVADSAKGVVYEFGSSGALEGKLTGGGSPQGSFRGKNEEEGNVSALAVDETSGDVLVAEAERRVVGEYDPAGEWVGWITGPPAGGFGEPRGVAVDASGQVYVADAGAHLVDVFAAGVPVPDVATQAASKLTRTTAVLNGTIDAEGRPARDRFEWGVSEALGSSTPAVSAGTGEEKVSVSLGELHAGSTYYYRMLGEGEEGSNVGVIREFTTAPAVEGLSSGPAREVTPTAATITGSLAPNGVNAEYDFEWGLTSSYGSQTPLVDAGEGKETVAAKAELSGLSQNTSYHYRIVAKDSYGTTVGSDQVFTTSGPPRITLQAPTGVGHETATLNAKIDPDEYASTYRFEYGETTAYGSEVPIGGANIPAGETSVPVSASLSGLKLGVTYHYRVIAENQAGEPVMSADETFTTVPPALIESESAGAVTATAAELQGDVNPLGNATTFYFQYGTEPCKPNPSACTDTPAAPGLEAGSGNVGVPGSEPIQGLQPDTTYRYRVLATNTLGTSEGPEHTFTTQSADTTLALADNRAWEMVSPPNKQGAPVEALTREGGIILASEDGDSFTYVVNGALDESAEGNRSPEWQQVIARREAHEWHSEDVATPSSKAKGIAAGHTPEYQFFAPGLSLALVQPPLGATTQAEPPLAPGVTQATMYLRENATGTYLPLVTEGNVAPGTVFGGQISFLSATPDLSHVVLSSQVALTGPSSAPGLYEWTEGALELVSVMPSGTPAKGLVELGYSHTIANAVSSEGSRIIWTTVEAEAHLGHLYMRDIATGETVKLDAAQGVSEPDGAGTARFQTASSDGSRVFFTDRQKLTPTATAEPLSNKPDLYECEMVVRDNKLACDLTDLSVDPTAGKHANVQGLLLGTSQEGTSTYFIAQGALAGNENGNGEHAVEGQDNLYQTHYEGGEWAITFIATLSSEDSPEWEGNAISNTAYLTARVSPDGRYLAFMSAASLTGYDNTDENSGKPDEEVYLYDSQSAGLRCVSCDPSGARPDGVLDTEGAGEGLGLLVDRRKVWFGHWLAGNIPGWTAENLTSALYQSRYLSDNGRLFFNSPDDLVAAATNHEEDVYEYEPAAVGSCESPTGGCVALLSSGSSPKESAFVEATPDGSNVFFVTAAQLLPQDTDTAFDIYDARECTEASPCLSPPAAGPAPCASAETCSPASVSQQIPGGPGGTATFSGSGNLAHAPANQQVKSSKTIKPLTRAQKLAQALKVCAKQHPHARKKRVACEKLARKLYGPKSTAKHAKNTAAKAKRSTSRHAAGRTGR